MDGGGLYAAFFSAKKTGRHLAVNVTGTAVTHNSAFGGSGGGLFVAGGMLVIGPGINVSYNIAGQDGGGIAVEQTKLPSGATTLSPTVVLRIPSGMIRDNATAVAELNRREAAQNRLPAAAFHVTWANSSNSSSTQASTGAAGSSNLTSFSALISHNDACKMGGGIYIEDDIKEANESLLLTVTDNTAATCYNIRAQGICSQSSCTVGCCQAGQSNASRFKYAQRSSTHWSMNCYSPLRLFTL